MMRLRQAEQVLRVKSWYDTSPKDFIAPVRLQRTRVTSYSIGRSQQGGQIVQSYEEGQFYQGREVHAFQLENLVQRRVIGFAAGTERSLSQWRLMSTSMICSQEVLIREEPPLQSQLRWSLPGTSVEATSKYVANREELKEGESLGVSSRSSRSGYHSAWGQWGATRRPIDRPLFDHSANHTHTMGCYIVFPKAAQRSGMGENTEGFLYNCVANRLTTGIPPKLEKPFPMQNSRN